MIQLFSSLIVPVPSNTTQLCNVPQNSIGYVNWGYAQIDALILTGGQKYNIELQNPGYVVLKLGTYNTGSATEVVSNANYFYNSFNLNEYNSLNNNNNIDEYYFTTANFNSLATAYASVDANGFVLDLTNLPNNYAVILGLVKFDYVEQFTSFTVKYPNGESFTNYYYGMSTALNNEFLAGGINTLQINFANFLGIPANTTIQFLTTTQPTSLIGYQLNEGFLVNDETVSNSAFNFPTESSNVVAVPVNANSSTTVTPQDPEPPDSSPFIFGSPQNITYYTDILLTNNTITSVEAVGSSYPPGLPNTNTIIPTDLTFAVPYVGSSYGSFKSLYNNNGYNDVWVLSNGATACQSVVFPPYFTPYNTYNGNYMIQLNSSNPDIIYQYIAQAPIVQISTSTTTSTVTTSSSTTALTPSTTTQTQTQTTTSSTSSTTVTNVTQQIVTALANPIVALILALALVGIAIFVLV
jgi:hypothetical protein